MSDSTTKAYYVAGAHWDREWYEAFQHFRYRLVETFDEVLDTLATDPRFACFQTDGQSCLLDDYLAIRPERGGQVRRFAREGRLRVGPWYTMPDEALVSGESLIRNLELGIERARDYGGVSRVGFVCDIFGHNSQLPQILRGFGIDNAMVWRGTNESTHGGAFRWQAADGSEVVAYRFGPGDGYFDYGGQVRRVFDQDKPFDLETSVQAAESYVRTHRERMPGSAILLYDGGDHMPLEPQTTALLDRLRQEHPGLEIVHTGLDEFMRHVVVESDRITEVFRGELRDPCRETDPVWVIPGVLSSRISLKQANRACETGLTMWVEPFCHLAGRLIGREYPREFIRRSWRYLLLNHAHDSICCCSPDQIARDMAYRFDQSRLISGKVLEEALRDVASRVSLPDLVDDEFAVVLFNPTQTEIDEPVDFELWFPRARAKTFQEFFEYEEKVGFRLFDATGGEVPYDYINYHPCRRRFWRRPRKVVHGQECIVVDVCAPVKIPACGYTTLVCKPLAEITRHPFGKMVTGDGSLENRHLRVEVNSNGSLCLHDKRSGCTYDHLLVFEDRADIGDGWYHGIAVNDEVCSSTAGRADVAVVEDGFYRATLKITVRMMVPERFTFDRRMCRSERRVEQSIENYVTLRRDGDCLEVRTVFDNRVRDHRVRVLFESGADSDSYWTDSAFDVIERPIALPEDNHRFKELHLETKPQASWTAVCDGRRGVAVVAPDLPETAVRDVPARPIALTLLRGYSRTIYTDGEIGCQELGPHEFRYRVVPLDGDVPRMKLAGIAQRVAGGIRAVDVPRWMQACVPDRTLPPAHGGYSLCPGRVVVTSCRRRDDDRLELRCYNPHDESVDETLTLYDTVDAAALVDFEGNAGEAVAVEPPGTLALRVGAKSVVTLSIRLRGGGRHGQGLR